MSEVRYLAAAKDDLFEIWRYIAHQSQELTAADRLIDSIDAVAALYASQPVMGTPRTDLAQGVRSFSVGNYVIFYVPFSGGIEVIQVIHGSRDIRLGFRGR